MTTIAFAARLRHLPEDTAALRAIVGNLLAERLHRVNVAEHALRDDRLRHDVFGRAFALRWSRIHEPLEKRAHAREIRYVVDGDSLQRAPRHFSERGIAGILNDGDPP